MEDRYRTLAGMIDHALLVPSLTTDDLEAGCKTAAAYQVASVCITPHYLCRCAEILQGSGVKPGTTVGFPHGGHATAVKVAEARRALADGGQELDMVVNIGQVVGGNWGYVRDEIKAVVDVTHTAGQKLKVIFENCYLNHEQKVRLCEICCETGADWVKTSTGFAASGATEGDVKLMVAHVTGGVQVKAAGGVRDLKTLLRFRELGATRVGLSRTAEVLEEYRHTLGLPPITDTRGPIAAPTGY